VDIAIVKVQKGNSNLYEEEEDEDNASDTNDAWE
jgi:hypothetical protein